MEFAGMNSIRVGGKFVVPWSNGAGYSVYRLVDNPGDGPHLLQEVEHYEINSDGGYVKLVPHE